MAAVAAPLAARLTPPAYLQSQIAGARCNEMLHAEPFAQSVKCKPHNVYYNLSRSAQDGLVRDEGRSSQTRRAVAS